MFHLGLKFPLRDEISLSLELNLILKKNPKCLYSLAPNHIEELSGRRVRTVGNKKEMRRFKKNWMT